MRRFLIALDLSDSSSELLEFGFEFNKYFYAELHVLHVFTVPFAVSAENIENIDQYRQIQKGYTDLLWNLVNVHKQDHFDVVPVAISGGKRQAIIDYIEKQHLDLLIIGHKQRKAMGRWFSGSITLDLLQKPPIDTLAIPTGYTWHPWKTIWACTDLSIPISDACCQRLKKIAEQLQCNIRFLHVSDAYLPELPEDRTSSQKIEQEFGQQTLKIRVKNSIPDTIQSVLDKEGGELLVLFPHPHTWIDRLLLGTETKEISSQLSIPVLSMKT
jgi:nucleotide-binding universal stress UspA family protein